MSTTVWQGDKKFEPPQSVELTTMDSDGRMVFEVTSFSIEDAVKRGLLAEVELTVLDRLHLRHKAEEEAVLRELFGRAKK